MEGQQQVRCPTPGSQDRTTHTPSPGAKNHNDIFNDSTGGTGSVQNQGTIDGNQDYLTSLSHDLQPPTSNQHAFLQTQNGSPHLTPQRDVFPSNMFDANGTISSGGNFEAQFFASTSDTQNFPLQPTFPLDPQLLEQQNIAGQSINPATLVNDMAAVQSHSPSSSNLVQSDIFNSSTLTNASASIDPPFSQVNFTSPNRSRHASLDPSTAAFPSGSGPDWARGAAFQHRRTPSDTYSDVSSSAMPSPFLGNLDNFDPTEHTSPLLQPEQDQTVLQNMVQFNQFSLSEASPSQVSPARSPHVSPQLNPTQQPLPLFMASNNFGLGPTFGETLTGSPDENPLANDASGAGADYIGQADQISTPQISIQLAPPSRQPSFEPERVDTALSPPPSSGRVPSRNRARSDPFVSGRIPISSRSSSTHPVPNPRPSLVTQISDPTSLSPQDIVGRSPSRSSSPRGRQSRSSSTSSIPRDVVISLADPSHQPSTSGSPGEGSSGTKRQQKHPANFGCHLCTKRFTRAYNLRSHLRTHTDERPFVCNVCGKAFARQHDRKRHEGLHSGEKKFVCRGTLKDGGAWGCSRRFARADALGRHFRSEAGRVCIKPLLEEESVERASKEWEHTNLNSEQIGSSDINMTGSMPMTNQNNTYFEGNATMLASIPSINPGSHGLSMFPSMATPPGVPTAGVGGNGLNQLSSSPSSMLAQHAAPPSSSSYALPAALLAQYPALAGIQWDALPSGAPDEIEGDLSGRSSFDASSGGEYYEDEDDSFKDMKDHQAQGQDDLQGQQQQGSAQLQQQQQGDAANQQLLYGP